MKTLGNKRIWFKVASVAIAGLFSFQASAFALTYGQGGGGDLLEWVDKSNEAMMIGAATAVAAPFAAAVIAPVAAGMVGAAGISTTSTTGIIATGALTGAAMGGISDLATGGDGTGALYGAASGGIFSGISGQVPGGNLGSFGDYAKGVGINLISAEVGKGLAAVAVNEWGMNAESAQFLGMTASGCTSLGLSQAMQTNQTKTRTTTNEDVGGVTWDIERGSFDFDFGGGSAGSGVEAGGHPILSPVTNNNVNLGIGAGTSPFVDAGVGVNNSDGVFSPAGPIAPNVQTQVATAPPTMGFLECVGLAATQAAIHVGVQSAFEDKEWAPVVASFAGEVGGSYAFANIAPYVTGKKFENYIPNKEAFQRSALVDAVNTGIQVAIIDRRIDAGKTKTPGDLHETRQRAQMLGNLGGTLAKNFIIDPGSKHKTFICNDFVDKLAEPAIHYGASLALNKISDQEKMHPATFSYFTAMNGANLQTVLGDEQAAQRFNDIQLGSYVSRDGRQVYQPAKMLDFGYDPQMFNGDPTGMGVYQTTRTNSQLWSFSDLDDIAYNAARVKKQGRDWRDNLNRRIIVGGAGVGAFSGRFTQVYNRAAMDSLTSTAYGISNRVLKPNPKPIVDKLGERKFANPAEEARFNRELELLREKIGSNPRPVTVRSGTNDYGDDYVEFGLSETDNRRIIDTDEGWKMRQTVPTESGRLKWGPVEAYNTAPTITQQKLPSVPETKEVDAPKILNYDIDYDATGYLEKLYED